MSGPEAAVKLPAFQGMPAAPARVCGRVPPPSRASPAPRARTAALPVSPGLSASSLHTLPRLAAPDNPSVRLWALITRGSPGLPEIGRAPERQPGAPCRPTPAPGRVASGLLGRQGPWRSRGPGSRRCSAGPGKMCVPGGAGLSSGRTRRAWERAGAGFGKSAFASSLSWAGAQGGQCGSGPRPPSSDTWRWDCRVTSTSTCRQGCGWRRSDQRLRIAAAFGEGMPPRSLRDPEDPELGAPPLVCGAEIPAFSLRFPSSSKLNHPTALKNTTFSVQRHCLFLFLVREPSMRSILVRIKCSITLVIQCRFFKGC